VTDEEGGKVEESMMKHDKIFLGEVSCSIAHVSQDSLKQFALAQILERFLEQSLAASCRSSALSS
jgi:hypothetical protein